jgi:3-(3-hydroxy-phenyl)propionate hydroxylase
VRLSEQLGDIVMTTSEPQAHRRDLLVRRAVRTSEGRNYLEHMRYRPPQHYAQGLVIGGNQPSMVGVPIGQPLVFDTGSHRLRRLDDILGIGWALLAVDLPDDFWTEVEQVTAAFAPVTAVLATGEVLARSAHRVLIDVDGALKREFDNYTGRFVLLRPDKFVAATWAPSASSDIIAQLLHWTRPTIAARSAL